MPNQDGFPTGEKQKMDAIILSQKSIEAGYRAWKEGKLDQAGINALLLAEGCLRWGL